MTLLVENKALLDAFRKGEESALRRVYGEYVGKVAGYLKWNFHMTHADISDLLQTTFMRAFRSEARTAYDGTRPFINYLFRIAHNVAINELKRAWRRKENPPSGTDDAWQDAAASDLEAKQDDQAMAAQYRKLLDKLTASLSADEKRVFDLRFLEELSQEQTAKISGLTRQRVRTLEKKIRDKAYRIYKRSGYLPEGMDVLLLICVLTALIKEVA